MKKENKTAVKIGVVAGFLALLCCVSPVVLVLLGLSSVSAAIALGYNLYNNYKFYFLGLSFVFLMSALYIHLRKEKVCNLQGIRRHKNMIIVAVFVTILIYIFLFYFTTWLAYLYSR